MLQPKWLPWCIMLLLNSCEEHALYEHTYNLSECIWHRQANLKFNFPIQDTTQAYDVYVVLKNVSAYPYQNLYLAYYLRDSKTALSATEIKNYPLFEAKTGKPLGKGWKKHTNKMILIKNHYFTHLDDYTLELAQSMRSEMLPGICSVGIKICKAKQPITQ